MPKNPYTTYRPIQQESILLMSDIKYLLWGCRFLGWLQDMELTLE
jgi:hypothetical protein